MIDVKKLIEFSILRMDVSLKVENELNVFASILNENSSAMKDNRFTDYEVYRHYSKEYPSILFTSRRYDSTNLSTLYKSFELINGVWSAYLVFLHFETSDDNIKNLHSGTVNLDLLQGTSKSKGCYVGQEVYTSYVNHVGEVCPFNLA